MNIKLELELLQEDVDLLVEVLRRERNALREKIGEMEDLGVPEKYTKMVADRVIRLFELGRVIRVQLASAAQKRAYEQHTPE